MDGFKISNLDDKSSAGREDLVPIVDVSASGGYATKKTTISGLISQAVAFWWSGNSDKSKLDGIQANATANSTDAQLRDRSTHTGTQSIGTVDGLQTALESKASASDFDQSLKITSDVTHGSLTLNGQPNEDPLLWGTGGSISVGVNNGPSATVSVSASSTVGQFYEGTWSGGVISVSLADYGGGAPESSLAITPFGILFGDGTTQTTAATSYSLPTASSTVKGGVKIGSGVSIDGSGVISVNTNYAATSHAHGNITSDGKVGTVADKVLVTTTAGAVTAASSITFSQVADTATYTNFSTTPGNIGAAFSGIDSAISGKAAASHTHAASAITSGRFNYERLPLAIFCESIGLQPAGIPEVPGDVSVLYVNNGADDVLRVMADGHVSCTAITLAGTDLATTLAGKASSSHNTSHWPDGTDPLFPGDIGAATALHAHSASDVTGGTFDIARIPTGTTSTTVSLGNHTHSQLHDRSHAITSTSDHTAGNWKVIYTNGSGQVVELALGAANTVLQSNGASSAPTFGTVQKTITSGTAAPTGGSDGDIYLQYT